MNNRTFAQVLDREKYLPIGTVFVVAVVHFMSSFLLKPLSCAFSLESSVAFVLSAPSFILGFIIDSLPKIAYVAFASVCYGIMGGLLVSKNRKMQWFGILLLCLLILSSCYLMLIAAQLCA